jgi:hypothetical protein
MVIKSGIKKEAQASGSTMTHRHQRSDSKDAVIRESDQIIMSESQRNVILKEIQRRLGT